MEEEREKFEAWRKDCGYNTETFQSVLWLAWQAALAPAHREIAIAATVCPEVAGYTPSQVIAHLTVELSAARDRLAGGEPVYQEQNPMGMWQDITKTLYDARIAGEYRGGPVRIVYAAPAPASPAALTVDVDAIMAKIQEFASTWAVVGGRFDDGSAMERAEECKAEIRALLDAQPAATMVYYGGSKEPGPISFDDQPAEDARASRPYGGDPAEPRDDSDRYELSAQDAFDGFLAENWRPARQQGALSDELPPLPRPHRNEWPHGFGDLYSAEQMRDYARSAIRAPHKNDAQQRFAGDFDGYEHHISRASSPRAEAQAVPEGYVLVPVTPTDEMLAAMLSEGEYGVLAQHSFDPISASTVLRLSGVGTRYANMLAAAEAPIAEGSGQ